MQHRAIAPRNPETLFAKRQKRIAIWTAKHVLCNAVINHGMVNIDCGSKTGYPMFRPSSNLYLALHQGQGKHDEEWLMQAYLNELRQSYERSKRDWLGILDSKRIVVTCERSIGHKLAHRYVLRTFLCEIAIENDYKVLHGGEVQWADNSKKELMYTDW